MPDLDLFTFKVLTLGGTVARAATFSDDRLYRYDLRITWGDGDIINFLMLNPSTADEVSNDPTVERCERRARSWGCGGLIITNLFAWRATQPGVLVLRRDPVGPDNDAAIVRAAIASNLVICAWGTNVRPAPLRSRVPQVRSLLDACAPFKQRYLRLAKDGTPCHPLYLPYSELPKQWNPGEMKSATGPTNTSKPTG